MSGRPVSGRRLEDWDHEGLLPVDRLDKGRELQHYRLLGSLTGPGKVNDQAALVLAEHEFGCRRYRDVLVAEWPDCSVPTGDPETEDGFATAERTATVMAEHLASGDVPPMAQPARVWMRRNIVRMAPSYGETPEDLQHSLLTSVAASSMRGENYSVDGLKAAAGLSSGEFVDPELEELAKGIRGDAALVSRLAANAPLSKLVGLAQDFRALLDDFGLGAWFPPGAMAILAPLNLSKLMMSDPPTARVMDGELSRNAPKLPVPSQPRTDA